MAGCFLYSTTETPVWFLNADVVDRNQRNRTFCGESIASPVSFPEVPFSTLDSPDDGKLEANVNNWRSVLTVGEVTKNHRGGRLWATDCCWDPAQVWRVVTLPPCRVEGATLFGVGRATTDSRCSMPHDIPSPDDGC